MLHEVATRSSAQLSASRRRHTAPTPYAAQRAVPGVLTDHADIREYFRQAQSRFEQDADQAIWDRWCLNSHPCEEGTVDEHVAVLRDIVRELADQLKCLAIIGGELSEHNPDLEPPYQPLKTAAALREMLSRRMAELYGPMAQTGYYRRAAFIDRRPGEPYLNGNWPLVRLSRVGTSYGSVNNGTELAGAREISAAALQEALTARRWPGVPVITRTVLARAAGQNEASTAELPIRLAALAAGGQWCGTLSQLAELVCWSRHVNGLIHALAAIEPELQTLGVSCSPTGKRTGRTRAAEWCVSPVSGPPGLRASAIEA